VRHYSSRQPVERSLQNEHGGMLIDDLGAAGAGHVGGDQLALDRGGGEALVPQRDRELRQARQIAGKGAR